MPVGRIHAPKSGELNEPWGRRLAEPAEVPATHGLGNRVHRPSHGLMRNDDDDDDDEKYCHPIEDSIT
jgi:hypothetical protein